MLHYVVHSSTSRSPPRQGNTSFIGQRDIGLLPRILEKHGTTWSQLAAIAALHYLMPSYHHLCVHIHQSGLHTGVGGGGGTSDNPPIISKTCGWSSI